MRECKTEKGAFNALRKHGGMVQYLSGFNHQEIQQVKDGTATSTIIKNKVKETHNILLEYGDHDLADRGDNGPPAFRIVLLALNSFNLDEGALPMLQRLNDDLPASGIQ